MINLIILIATAGLWSCCSDPIPPGPEDMKSPFELVWATRMDFEKEIVGSDQQQFYENHFICFGDLDDPASIYGYHADTGLKDWEHKYEGNDKSNIDFNCRFDHILICVTANRVFGFDLNSKVLIWEYFIPLNHRRGKGEIATNEKFYLVIWENFNPLGGFNQILMEFDPDSGEHREVVKYFPDSIGTKTISPPVFWPTEKKLVL